MNKDLEIIFRDMEEQGLIGKFKTRRQIKNAKHIKHINPNVEKIFIEKPSSSCILKKSNDAQGLVAVASSRMYNKAGIQTPQIFLVGGGDKKVVQTIQEDVSENDDFETTLAGDDIEFTKICWNVFGKFKWQIFYDANYQYGLLKLMTEECLEQLKNMFLADELRTDIDRHTINYFF